MNKDLLLEKISKETEIPIGTIRGWRSKWGFSSTNTYRDVLTGTIEEIREKLIKIMQDAPKVSYMYFNSKDSGTPAATTYRKYFGSWDNALQAAGITDNRRYSMKEGIPTKVYLIEFDGFYKVGITQQSIKDRFHGGYPNYEVLMCIETTLEEARIIEKQWLESVKDFKFIATESPAEGRGTTECFKF